MPSTNKLRGSAFRDAGLGILVTKDCDLATDPDPLFDVTGKVLITLITGEVTVVVATTTTIFLERTTGPVPLCAATTITTDAVGTMYMLSGDTGAIMNGTLAAGDAPVIGLAQLSGGPIAPIVFGLAGVAETIRSQLDGAGTGTIRFSLYYIPLEPGAKVVAAA